MVAEAMDFKGDLVVSFVNQYIVESIGGFYGSYLTKKGNLTPRVLGESIFALVVFSHCHLMQLVFSLIFQELGWCFM